MSKLLYLAVLCIAVAPLQINAYEWNSSSIDGHYVLSSMIDESTLGEKKIFFALYKAKYNNNGFERFLSQCNKAGFDSQVTMLLNGKNVTMDKICQRTADSKNYWIYTPSSSKGTHFLITQFKYTETINIGKTFVGNYNQKSLLNFNISAKGFTQAWDKSFKYNNSVNKGS